MSDRSEELKQCPHCGSKAQLDDCRTIWRVVCTNTHCEAVMLGERAPEPEDDAHCDSIDWAHFEQTAIDRWNRRAEPVASQSVNVECEYFPAGQCAPQPKNTATHRGKKSGNLYREPGSGSAVKWLAWHEGESMAGWVGLIREPEEPMDRLQPKV